MRHTILFILLGLLLSSCMPPRVNPEKLHVHYEAHAMEKLNHMAYMGSKGRYHYFHHYRISMMKREYRVLKEELPIADEFPLTEDRKQWRPYMVLKVGSEPGPTAIILSPHRSIPIQFDPAPILEGFVPAEP